MFEPRHIQVYGESNTTIKHYWGYPDRVLPCTSDKGTCAYLDAVYGMHETSMLYTFILWAALGGVLGLLLSLRYTKSLHRSLDIQTPFSRGLGAIQALGRRWMLPEAPFRRFFGRVTKLQIAVLLTLAAYLLIFSLVGIVYKTWVTPVKKLPGVYNTRTGLGGFADRVGAMAYALTPFTIVLCTRESILSLLTGVPYQHFNFLHRWTGRIIFLQSFLHTLGWTIVEGKLYQPQPKVYKALMQEQYIILGVVAQFFITFLYIFSTSWAIRWTGYEFFKRTHYAIALLYLGACWGHWDGLACWMIASLILLGLDKGARVVRTGLLHMGPRKGKSGLGFRGATATIQHFGNDADSVVRIDFDFEHSAWKPGAHFFLCFPALSLWQSHPFTPVSLPDGRSKTQHHTYLVRVCKGITADLANLAQASGQAGTCEISIVLTGPYPGGSSTTSTQNLLAIAGGTGVTSVLPAVLDALSCPTEVGSARAIDLVWIVRYARDLAWLAPELAELKTQLATRGSAAAAGQLRVRVFVTREATAPSGAAPSSSPMTPSREHAQEKSGKAPVVETTAAAAAAAAAAHLATPAPGFEVEYLDHSRPSIEDIVASFCARADICGGARQVLGSGPAAIGTLLREAVAKRNDASKMWEGDVAGGMGLVWDCRS